MERCPECASKDVAEFGHPGYYCTDCGVEWGLDWTEQEMIDHRWRDKTGRIDEECEENRPDWSLPWVAINVGPNASTGVLLRRC